MFILLSFKEAFKKFRYENSDILIIIKIQVDILAIFSKADKNKNGKQINDIIERYPQIAFHLKSKKLKNFVQ